MGLILHSRASDNRLSDNYRRAFADAVELIVVTAYLTEWDDTLKFNPRCRKFRFIVGKDFGITRKVACQSRVALVATKEERKGDFGVAEGIDGFHPEGIVLERGQRKEVCPC